MITFLDFTLSQNDVGIEARQSKKPSGGGTSLPMVTRFDMRQEMKNRGSSDT
jgi:hypothetical protein